MNNNLALLGVIFLLYLNGSFSLTQVLLLLALLSTNNQYGCNANGFNLNNTQFNLQTPKSSTTTCTTKTIN